jgi:D-lyxose ketol-isomerase
MTTREEFEQAQEEALRLLERAQIILTAEETNRIEVTDFGLGDLLSVGIESFTYVNTKLVCAKELVLLPRQTCPEHIHPAPGKEETFRCRWGEVYLYVPGEVAPHPKAVPPQGKEQTYTVWHEIILTPGKQHTVPQGTLHWFQAGANGAVMSEFSSAAYDDLDSWTDGEVSIS